MEEDETHLAVCVAVTDFSRMIRMRSKGSRFTVKVWGLRVPSLDVAFTVATVRNRSREVAMAVPMASKRGHF